MCIFTKGNAFSVVEHASAPLSLSVTTMLCVYMCCIFVHWEWGMWVGKMLKMESSFVGAVLRLIAEADEVTLISHKAFSQELYTPLTSATNKLITVVLVCVSPLRDHRKLLCHLIILSVIYPRKVYACVYPPLALHCLFVTSVNVHLPEELGYLLDYLLRFIHPESRSQEDVLTQSRG